MSDRFSVNPAGLEVTPSDQVGRWQRIAEKALARALRAEAERDEIHRLYVWKTNDYDSLVNRHRAVEAERDRMALRITALRECLQVYADHSSIPWARKALSRDRRPHRPEGGAVSDLRKLAEAAIMGEDSPQKAWDAFCDAAYPKPILAVLAERDGLRAALEEIRDLAGLRPAALSVRHKQIARDALRSLGVEERCS